MKGEEIKAAQAKLAEWVKAGEERTATVRLQIIPGHFVEVAPGVRVESPPNILYGTSLSSGLDIVGYKYEWDFAAAVEAALAEAGS